MSDQIPNHMVNTYRSGLTVASQQMMAAMVGAVDLDQMTGEAQFFDQLGQAVMQPRLGRAALVNIANVEHRRRQITAQDFDLGEWVDKFDKLRVLNDPTNGYTRLFSAAMARQVDKTVITAGLGTAQTGKTGATGVPLPSAQKIANGSTGFTLDKLQTGVQMLKTRNALMPGQTLHCAWTAKQEQAFINTSEVKSSDFNNTKVMTVGGVDEFYRVKFHLIEDHYDAAGTLVHRMLPKASTIRSCMLWAQQGIKLCIPLMGGSVDWIAERKAWLVSAELSAGATRMYEEMVVQLDVVEA